MFDLIVVGGGHAGCEAAHIAGVLGLNTLLVTANSKNIADMPCNPSIGGTAKGIIVREIDALGGIMGKVADRTHFQIKMLNNGKGPAVRSLRAQADKVTYPKVMRDYLDNTLNLTIMEGMVEDLIVKDNKVEGVILSNQKKIYSASVILTTGTYLKANILIGSENTLGGPHGEERSNYLSDNLKKLGLDIQRLKTGTPPRIKKDSIDFSQMEEETGDDCYYTFSFDNPPFYKIDEQQKCYLLYTNDLTHKIIRENLDKSAMYGGYVTGIGPRYCPSIEDKIVRFKDKERHQLFLEPESVYYDEWYLQGFSTSMPRDIQEELVHSLKGLDKAVITKYAYAIEYDALNPLEMKVSLENKKIENLFTAGQINGTSGYEEAAGQGLMAGINAHHKLKGLEPLVLRRDEAYIGVLIDDLVTKGTKEPYRMLTSRAEYRLILRHDNADLRLREIGYQHGTIDEERYLKLKKKREEISEVKNILRNQYLKLNQEVKDFLISKNIEIPSFSTNLYMFLKRPEINMDIIKMFVSLDYSDEVLEEVEIDVKYEGYIAKVYKEAEKAKRLEEKLIPSDINYDDVANLANEARGKLKDVRPISIGQASRISGVNPADIAILSVYLRKKYDK